MYGNLALYDEIVSNLGATVKWRGCVKRARGLVALVILSVMFIEVPAHGAPFDTSGQDWEGYSDFVRLLRDTLGGPRVIVTGKLDWSALTPADGLIIAYPEHGADTISAGGFVRAGGRIALLDDFGAGDDLLGSYEVQRVPLPARPEEALRDNPELAIAEPVTQDQPLTQGVDRVVTNHASGLAHTGLTTLLRVRGGSGSVAVAISLSSGTGRLVAVGDPSIFMNSMLRYPGNRRFGRNIADYLMEGRTGGHLYVVVRSFVETGSFAGTASAEHELRSMLDRLKGALNRDGLPPWMMYWFSFIVAMLVLFWILPRTTRTYKSTAPRFTRPAPLSLQGGPAGHAAALGAGHAYRGHAVLEWRRALLEDLTAFFGLPVDAGSAEVVRRVARLGVVDADAIRALERLLLRMAEIDTMIAAKHTHALEPIRDEEVVATGKLVQTVLAAVHRQPGTAA